MKIFHFIDSMRIGGSEGQTAEVAARQVKRGHDVTIGCLHLDGPNLSRLESIGVKCIEFPVAGGLLSARGLLRILKLSQLIAASNFDVVHTHDLYSNLMAIPAAALAKVPRIISSRRDLASWWWYTPRNRRILRWIQKLSHVVVANSQGVKNFLVEHDGFESRHVTVIRNAVDDSRFNLPSERSVFFSHWPSDAFIFVVVANMHTHTKGHRFLIECIESVRKKHPRARFALVGDGALRVEFESLCYQIGQSDAILFMGARTDVPRILASCDAAILPSLAEGLPNSVLEYMAAARPIIATQVGGIPELIDQGVTGLLVPPADTVSLANAIMQVMDDPMASLKMGQLAREKAQSEFSYERLLDDIDSIYKNS